MTTADVHHRSTGTHRLTGELFDRLNAGVAATGRDSVAVEEVFTGARLTNLRQSTPADVPTAVQRARVAQTAWADTPFRSRAAIIRRFTGLLRAESETFLDLLQAETGKARWDAFIELLEPCLTLGYYVRNGESILRDQAREPMLPLIVETTEVRQPKGIVGVVAPWNFPLAIGISDSITAVLAGNAAILKPSNQTAFSSLLAAELLWQAGLPNDVFQIVAGPGATVGRELLRCVDYIAFTGSTDTGIRVARQAADQLVGCTLELGGKNAAIVLDDADLDSVADAAQRACFMHAGQVCMAIEKILVPEAKFDRFVESFAAATRSADYCTDYSYNGRIGSLTSAQQLDNVTHFVADAVAKGATAVAGGISRPDLGPYYYEPTILTGVTEEMSLHAREVFGPVVAVYPYRDTEHAVAMANEGDFGLNASVFSRNTGRAAKIARRIRAGTVNINEGMAAAYGSMGAPAGGMGKSGLGRRHGAEGILKYTDAQTVAIQRAALHAPYSWIPRQLYQDLFKVGLTALDTLRIR